MSLKAIKEASNAVVHDSTEPRYCTKCRLLLEITALEDAAKALNEAGWLTVIPEEPRRTQSEADAAVLLATIAKEAE